MLKIISLVIFYSFSSWGGGIQQGKLLDLLSMHPEKNMANTNKEKTQREKCHQMFSANPNYSNWIESIRNEVEAKGDLFLAKEANKESKKEYLIAKKTRKMHEKAFKKTSSEHHAQIFKLFKEALEKEQSAFKEKEEAKKDLREAQKNFNLAKLNREQQEINFKSSISTTFPQDFENPTLKKFKSLSSRL